MTNLEIREAEIRAADLEERTVTGIAVPWEQPARIGDSYTEKFARGAVQDSDEALLFYGHKEPIGRVIRHEDTEAGWEITAKISQTPRGDEVLTLLRDGVLSKFSIGFEPIDATRSDDGVVTRTKVRVRECSVVPFPAYAGAAVAAVRSDDTQEEDTSMDDTMSAEVSDLREAVADLEREVRSAVTREAAPAADQFRDGGEWLKALADGDENAKTLVRAFTGATTAEANVQPAWVQRQLRLVQEKRPLINLFGTTPLPRSMTVSYPTISSVSGTVSAQGPEGSDLPYMEIALGNASVPVVTYGGYSSLSRQAIELSDQPYLQKVLEYQANQYAKATEAAVRATLVGGSGYQAATLSADTAAGWIDLVIDSLGLIEDNGQGAAAEFMLVSRDVFKRIAHITDSAGRPVFVVNGDGSNTIGNVNVTGGSANIAGLPVVVGRALGANSVYVASREALAVFESSGAPFRLQDENIINLTKDFSLYGYLANGVANPNAVVKVDADLV